MDKKLTTYHRAASKPHAARIYLAQASLSDLPDQLRSDVPTPDLVLKAGKGDIYDTSIWIGAAPTYTPLHRDPNPNLFVQLAGKKRVRMFAPEVGRAVFAHVQQTIGASGSATMRGAEMMEGEERRALEEAVWDDEAEAPWREEGLECEVDAGDGLFIPKGWWHSIKGVGEGMTGSVSLLDDCDEVNNTLTAMDRSTGGFDDRSFSTVDLNLEELRKYLVIRLHQLVSLNHLRKSLDLGRMTPWLQFDLLPYDRGETTRPSLPWIPLDYTFDRLLMYQLRIQACVIKCGGQMSHGSNCGMHSCIAQVLVPDDSFGYRFVLRLRGIVLLQ